MRNKIKEKLLEIDSTVFYGMVPDNIELKELNYIVFNSRKLRKKGSSSNDLSGYWNVAIVREDYIADELVQQVIDSLTSLAGLRLADTDFNYEYFTKGGTNTVVEILVLQFTKMKKGIKSCQQ